MTNYIISYDIIEDRYRLGVARLLLARGCKRLQKSVFFAPRYGNEEIRELEGALRRVMLGAVAGSSIFCVSVSREAAMGMHWIGDGGVGGILGEDWGVLL